MADVLLKLLDTEGGQSQCTSVLGNKHVLCWGFEDMLGSTEKESAQNEKEKDTKGKIAVNSVLTCSLL